MASLIDKMTVWHVDIDTLEIEEMTIAELRWSFNADAINQATSYLCSTEAEAQRYVERLKEQR